MPLEPSLPSSVSCTCGETNCEIPYGTCHCGCGEKTKISPANWAPFKWKKGEPRRFASGHQARLTTAPYVEEDRGYKTPCWIWVRQLSVDGYAMGTDPESRRTKPAHVFYFKNNGGHLPKGFEVDHLCRVRACVNPDHLEAVSPAVNSQRRGNTKMTPDAVRSIRADRENGILLKDLAAKYGISTTQAHDICRRKTWRNI